MAAHPDDPYLVIESRFNGPPGSGNGGYTAGLVASTLAAPDDELPPVAEVTLRSPPPLDTPLLVSRTGDRVEVSAAGQLVAEARRVAAGQVAAGATESQVEVTGEPVPLVPMEQVQAATARYPGFVDHPFPTCYVCGPRRAGDDGLRIFPGPLPDGRTAATWEVPPDVSAVTVWAALDCPGGWAIIGPGRPYVLGRIAARVDALPPPGATCVIMGAVTATQGRKAQVRTSLYGPGGALLAQAWSVWIAI